MQKMTKILSCEFEVFGIVQGVSFRMYTQRQAQALGVRGWCMNTRDDTVKGAIEAPQNAFEAMRTWLTKTGSPTSRIDKVNFTETKALSDYTYADFTIRH